MLFTIGGGIIDAVIDEEAASHLGSLTRLDVEGEPLRLGSVLERRDLTCPHLLSVGLSRSSARLRAYLSMLFRDTLS